MRRFIPSNFQAVLVSLVYQFFVWLMKYPWTKLVWSFLPDFSNEWPAVNIKVSRTENQSGCTFPVRTCTAINFSSSACVDCAIWLVEIQTQLLKLELFWKCGGTSWTASAAHKVILRSECGGTRRHTGGEVKGKLANGVGIQYPSHYLGTWCIQHYYYVPKGQRTQGFRCRSATADHIFCIRHILEKKWESSASAILDFKKAYDSITREVSCNILIEFGIPWNG